MPDRPLLRAALVGAGHISAQHAPAWVATDDASLVAVCDVDRARAENRAAQLAELGHANVVIFTSVDEMLASTSIDCVDIATRPDTHRELIERFAKSGVHVLCQKPLAASLGEAKAMVDVCAQAGVRFMVT